MHKAPQRWQDWVNAILGAWLFIAPWVLKTTIAPNSSWNAWIAGTLIVATAAGALATPQYRSAEWTNLALGFWVFISPWVLGFAAVTAAAWNAWIIGAAVVILAAWALAEMPRTPQHQGPTGQRQGQPR